MAYNAIKNRKQQILPALMIVASFFINDLDKILS